jgi:hypothetical protein
VSDSPFCGKTQNSSAKIAGYIQRRAGRSTAQRKPEGNDNPQSLAARHWDQVERAMRSLESMWKLAKCDSDEDSGTEGAHHSKM